MGSGRWFGTRLSSEKRSVKIKGSDLPLVDGLSVKQLAFALQAELRDLQKWNTPNERAVRQRYSNKIKHASPDFVLALARELIGAYQLYSTAYEIICEHKGAFALVGEAELVEFGQGIDSWWRVDTL